MLRGWCRPIHMGGKTPEVSGRLYSGLQVRTGRDENAKLSLQLRRFRSRRGRPLRASGCKIKEGSCSEAVRKLRRVLSDCSGPAGEVKIGVASPDIEYVEFYVSPHNIHVVDIDEN